MVSWTIRSPAFPDAPWVPEAPGEAMLVNGKLFPYLDVEPRKYRFRVLNAANSRFFHLSLSNGQPFMQIGTDQGLLPEPVAVAEMMIAPGERVDRDRRFRGARGRADRAALRIVYDDAVPRGPQASAADESSLPAKLRPVPKTPESPR